VERAPCPLLAPAPGQRAARASDVGDVAPLPGRWSRWSPVSCPTCRCSGTTSRP